VQKLINNTLVPIDFDSNWEPVLEQAIHMANHFQSDLHVLLIKSAILASSARKANEKKRNEEITSFLTEKYAHQLDAGLSFRVSSNHGLAEQAMEEYAICHQVELIVIGRTHKTLLGGLFYSISINKLARKTKAAILTVRDTITWEHIKNIVLPVNGYLPVRKIIFATYLARMFNSRIHLIGLTKRHAAVPPEDSLYLHKTHQLLKQNTNLSIECHTMAGENIADTTLEYARQVKADLIIVNPGKELVLSGFLNRLFTRYITNESGIPVLTIAQLEKLPGM
jgi:K+-sensing histidine kinase KdpD